MSLWDIEEELAAQGLQAICGADEAGAGPLAGAVYAAAVILPLGVELEGLNDSKQLTEKKREQLFPLIQEKAVAWAVRRVEAEEIDEINILQARLKAMELSIQALDPPADFALIDGNRDKGISCPHKTVVKGDSKSANIAAASILAKVSRDHYMLEMDRLYPQYGFARHKGYPTKAHYQALAQFGPCPIHRKTFLKKLHAQL
ncbi:MAG: ribonuclease HII [Oscillospiraceae bacterium]|nr:ribonuclease HII [Oscillospiraceae bacterium]